MQRPSTSSTEDIYRRNTEMAKNQQFSIPRDRFVPGKTTSDRLRQIFRTNEYGHISCELALMHQLAIGSLFTGLLIGGAGGSLDGHRQFIRGNKLTPFQHPTDAKVRLRDNIMVTFMRTGGRLGINLAILNTLALSSSFSIAAAKNKLTAPDFMLGFGSACALHRWRLGIRGVVGGLTVGLAFGSIASLLVWTGSLLMGRSVDDIYLQVREEYFQYRIEEMLLLREIVDDPESKNARSGGKVSYFSTFGVIKRLKQRLKTLNDQDGEE